MMSDNDIRKGFQSKLNGFEAPLPVDGWESVERSLKAAAATRMSLRRRWYAGSAAAVLVLLVGSILFMRNPGEQTGMLISESGSTVPPAISIPDPEREMIQEPQHLNEPVVRQTENQSLLAEKRKGKVRSEKGQVVHPSTPGGMLAAWMKRKNLQIRDAEERADADALKLLAKYGETEENQYGKDQLTEETIIVGGDHGPLFAGGIADERGEGTLLLAVNGRGGLNGYQQTVNSPLTLRSASAPVEDKYSAEANKLQLQANNVAGSTWEMEHDQPVSFGITVSKYLLDNLSVETGLVYSYLHSRTRKTGNYSLVEGVQKFHYLGVPVNVNYNLFSLNKLNVYTSIGGMVEKDIYGEYRSVEEGQAVNFNNVSKESEVKEKISQQNPQLSVNAGVGLSYPVYDKLRLYGKIGGAYYFDAKNENKTIYSDRKIVMDLNLGLRYEF